MNLVSRAYSYFFLLLAIAFIIWVDFNSALLLVCVIVPFILVSLIYEAKDPLLRKPLQDGELKTDVISFVVVLVFTFVQNYLIHVVFFQAVTAPDVVSWVREGPCSLSQLPFWLECVVAFLIYDFVFYWMHRLAHTNSVLWSLHEAHHSPNKITYMNSNRIHPLDQIIRRVVPMLIVIAFGITEQAFVMIGALISVIGPVTHFNINLKHGVFNYLIGTNEVHVWHHSANQDEAKNFGITMLWDHLFGTFYFPKGRRLPARMGLSNEEGYPKHSYLKQLMLPFKVHK